MQNYPIYEICAALATLVFIILGIYAVKALIALTESLKQLNSSISKLDEKIGPISQETLKLLMNSNELAESVQDKLEDLDPLMGSISNVGSALEHATSSFANNTARFKFFQQSTKRDWQDTVGDILELAAAGASAWQKFKKDKK
jgi:uncharacterized protein YoxC